MTKENLAMVKEPINTKEAKDIMAKENRKLLVVDNNNFLSGLMTIGYRKIRSKSFRK